MFIDAKRYVSRPPSGGPCQPTMCVDVQHQRIAPWREARSFRNVNMALLTEGGPASQRVYKHGPPDGGPNHFAMGL